MGFAGSQSSDHGDDIAAAAEVRNGSVMLLAEAAGRVRLPGASVRNSSVTIPEWQQRKFGFTECPLHFM
jgi:hypothetical protein